MTTVPTPADYTTCIACGEDFAPPNGTDLCPLCRKPHEPADWRYKAGCRCDGCREAHRKYGAERRAKALAEGALSHGVAGTYDAGCRCDKCYEARRVKYFTAPSEYKPKTGRRRMTPVRRVLPDST